MWDTPDVRIVHVFNFDYPNKYGNLLAVDFSLAGCYTGDPKLLHVQTSILSYVTLMMRRRRTLIKLPLVRGTWLLAGGGAGGGDVPRGPAGEGAGFPRP